MMRRDAVHDAAGMNCCSMNCEWLRLRADDDPVSSRLPADLIIAAAQIQSLITAPIVFARESLHDSSLTKQMNSSDAILTVIITF